MANLKEIRTRISSVVSTKQVTSAMKMVSAAKLRKAQDAITNMRPYATHLQGVLAQICSTVGIADDNVYAKKRDTTKVLIVSISSNRGLCGALNSNVFKACESLVSESFGLQLSRGNVHFFSIGKKINELLQAQNYKIDYNNNQILDQPLFNRISEIADEILTAYAEKKYDKVFLVYTQFKNAAVQYAVTEQFLPVQLNSEQSKLKEDYIFEPSQEGIVDQIIPKSLKNQFFKAVLDSIASEHGARMTAMHKATDSATELIRELKLNYNQARQAAITTEILEIVSGAEALKG